MFGYTILGFGSGGEKKEYSMQFYVVAGGGGANAARGGGAGGGGSRASTQSLFTGDTLNITVGAGGTGQPGFPGPSANKGSPSSIGGGTVPADFVTITSTGGGQSQAQGGAAGGAAFPTNNQIAGNEGGFSPPEGGDGGAGGPPPNPGSSGGGGGAGFDPGSPPYPGGGAGGSGVVIVRAPADSFPVISVTGGSNTKGQTPAPDGAATLLTFNETGTIVVG
jgi:hypothetical protein